MAPLRKQISRKQYSEETIKRCLQVIASGKTVYAGCKQFGIPMSTIRYRMSGLWKEKYKPGPESVLTKSEEQKIVRWLGDMQDRGFPVSRRTLRFKVSEFLSSDPSRITPFRNNQPGRKWLIGFMRRNPGFSFRTPEAVSSAGGRVTEKDIRGWFQMIEKWLTENHMREILNDPGRVFNGDETSFYLHPKTKEVIARTGSRNVYEVEQAAGKQNVTVMISFGAAGVKVTPHVILPGKRLRKEVVQGFPPDYGIGQSDRGWMDTHNFREYINKTFHLFLVKQGVQFPVILFVDGHASHNSLEVADLCQSLGIVLISLYPNTTHITQPADVAVFKPLKSEYRQYVEAWKVENPACVLTLPHFGGVLSKAVETGITTKTIKNGFRACGLQPFDPNAVDYSKCIAKSKAAILESSGTSNCMESSAVSQGLFTVPADQFAEQSCSEVQTGSPTVPHAIFAEEAEHSTEQRCNDDRTVPISIDRIVEAYDMIGPNMVVRIEESTDDYDSMPMEIHISNCEIINVEEIGGCYEDLSKSGELLTVEPSEATSYQAHGIIDYAGFDKCDDSIEHEIDEPNGENSSQSNKIEQDAESDNNGGEKSCPSPDDVLQDATNHQKVIVRRRLSSILKLPPTPRRSGKHRNYVKQYQPVLTAGERLEEIRKKEEQKVQMELQKKRKAIERQEAKQKRLV
nr:uncharacterized protein LOC115262239 [Aedes albopictus]